MRHKIGLFILSLWMLFSSIVILNIHIPSYNEGNSLLVEFLKSNYVSLIAIIAIIIGFVNLLQFNYFIAGSKNIPLQIIEIENINYEHLTFLTTYIIPLICFDLSVNRYSILLPLLILAIGAIYIKTNLYFANPTLALLGFHIYKVNTQTKKNIIIITKSILDEGDWINTISFDNDIYYAKLNSKHKS